jgi:hypothetical protein
MTKLTEAEVAALRGVVASEYHDGRDPVDNPVWTWSCNPFQSKRTFSGAVSSLVRKGLLRASGDFLSLTAQGKAALEAAS